MSASRKRKATIDNIIALPQPNKKRKICISSIIGNPVSNINNSENRNSNLNDNTPGNDNDASTTDHSQSKVSTHTVEYIQFALRSWGWKDPSPYKSYIKLTNNETQTKGLKIFDQQKRRGHRIVVVDGISGNIEQSITFDTWADIYAGIRLRIFLQTLQFKPNKWVFIIIHDSGYNINTEAAWNLLQQWGATQRPRHREAYTLIFSTNGHQNWWEHIVKPAEYFDKKYNLTIHSWKKRKKKYKKKKRKQNDANIITESQLNMLQSYGGCNVFFEKKMKPGKGALFLKGFLPKMIAIDEESHRKYTKPSPVELALKNGIKPCDTETNTFYCVACLNSSDMQHMLVCNDDAHFEDDNVRNVLPKELAIRQATENATAADEIDSKFRVRSCGQAFHIYCVTYPDQIWLRWARFMDIQFDDASVTPAFVEQNIEKQQNVWKSRNFGGAVNPKKNTNLQTDGKEIDRCKKEEKDEAHEMETGNIDFYVEDYAENYQLTPKIRDLTEWCCHSHRRDHRIFCRCGNPMVQQLCRYANGETQIDLQKGFRGLYCNKKKKHKNQWKGCAQYIAPDENSFRCMSGARCKESEDGWDYCMKCIVDNLTKHKPNVRCLCGKRLILGTVHDVRSIFNVSHDTKTISSTNTIAKSSKIKKANTYRCAWCLCKFGNKKTAKMEYLFYCSQQNNVCQRIIKNHFIQYQPFAVCIACVVQSSWMSQTCLCGSNLHCRLLADWIHHDIDAYNGNILETAPPKPNSFSIHNHKNNDDKLNDNNDVNVTVNTSVDKESAYSLYIQQRANNNEETFYNEMSKKYVECALCSVKISAYQFVFICNNALKHSKGTFYLCGKCAVKQREATTLFPASNEKVEICLLFVAHDGVSQPSLWQKWLEPTKQPQNADIYNKFGVAVQCNNFCALKNGKQFAEEYRIDVQRQTSWGKLLVPLAIQKSIQISLTKYPNCRRFYIISGREIPLVSAHHLYSMPNKTQLMAKKITKQTATRLSKKRMGKLLQWYSHHAAMCLERDHAEMVSVAPWKEYFNDSDHIYDHVGAPDEFLFGTTLNAMGVDMRKEIWREVTTDFELPTKTDVRHPISWENLDKIHEFWRVNELMRVEGKEKKTLKQYLQDGYKKSSKLWGYGPCFFRKVSSNVVFDAVPWEWCTMKPPVVETEEGIDETIVYRKELNSQAYMDQDEMY